MASATTSATLAAVGPIHSQAMNLRTASCAAAGEHFDPAVRQITRVAGYTSGARALGALAR